MTDSIQPPEWIRFYSPDDDYFEFSNFYKGAVWIDSEKYTSVEHYYQSQKYSKDVGKNLEFAELIKRQNTPGQAKILANPVRSVRWGWEQKLKEIRQSYQDSIHFDRVEWDQRKDSVMSKALTYKFTNDLHCRRLLLSTGNAILSENTKRDPYWANGGDPAKVGRLGELLMEVRNGLKQVN